MQSCLAPSLYARHDISNFKCDFWDDHELLFSLKPASTVFPANMSFKFKFVGILFIKSRAPCIWPLFLRFTSYVGHTFSRVETQIAMQSLCKTNDFAQHNFCCPFFFQAMNLVDFLAILPYFISLCLESLEDLHILGKAGKIMRLVRVMRILRIFKLVRHFAGLQSLLYTLKQVLSQWKRVLKSEFSKATSRKWVFESKFLKASSRKRVLKSKLSVWWK
jgi:hypothetical protein